jgi:hypothetical protein
MQFSAAMIYLLLATTGFSDENKIKLNTEEKRINLICNIAPRLTH